MSCPPAKTGPFPVSPDLQRRPCLALSLRIPSRPRTATLPPEPRLARPPARLWHRCRSAQHGPVSPAGDHLRRCVPYHVSPLSVLTTLAVACAGDSCRALERPQDAGPLYISSRSV